MRVLIDTTFARRGPTGTGVYLTQLVRALRALEVDVIEASNARRRDPGGGGSRSAANYAGDEWWTAVELPRLAREHRADVLHHPLPAFAPRSPCPQVVTVHDLAFERLPWAFDPRYRAWARRAHRRAARRAAAVVCPSHATALDVRSRWRVSAETLYVAPHGPGQLDEPLPRAPDPSHFLYVGDDEPRKNLPMLAAAYRAYRSRAGAAALPLVMAGRARPSSAAPPIAGRARPSSAALPSWMAGRARPSSAAALPLVFAGPARAKAAGVIHDPEPDLPRLLAAAAALVHPSFHEGFGITVLEAMRAGTPVIAGASAGIAELTGGAAALLDPRDPEVFASAMLAPSDGEPGRTRAQAFSWERSARAHVQAYTVALDRR